MTETYKAGEHVKIVLTDYGYESELGDQTGLVGTVVQGGTSVYVTFPHTGDKQFYYVQSEVVRAPRTKPLPEPLKVGDWVKVEGYSSIWDGTVGQIATFNSSGISANIKKKQTDLFPLTFPLDKLVHTEKPAPVFAEGDRVEFTENYGRAYIGDAGTVRTVEDGETGEGDLLKIDMDKGILSVAFVHRVKHSTKRKPIPAAKYAVGDWVQVTGYGNGTWNGVKGKVTMVGSYDSRDGYSYIIAPHEGKPYLSGGFEEKYLKTTTKPFIPAHKVGDWVEVFDCCNYNCNGTVWQVEQVPTGGEIGNYYRLKNGDRSVNYGERSLKAATKPKPKAKFKVGDWVELTNWNSTMNGEKLQVRLVPDTANGYYKFEGKDDFYGFSDDYLKATETPHWTETKLVGATAQATYRGGGTNRIITKTGEDQWLHIYQDSAGKANVTAYRNNERTKNLFGSDTLKWVVAEEV